jgi:hypothetical protein
MWIGTTPSLTFAAAMLTAAVSFASTATAQSAVPATHVVRTTSQHAATDMSAQHRRTERPPTRLRVHPRYNPDEVYPRYNPGPNAVRDCTATYVEEFRPSGTVIVPRMNCFWRRG